MRDSVQGLAKNTSAGLSPADLEALQKRIAALEQAVRIATGDKAARLALTAAALRDAVVRGAPFTAELGEAKSLGADEKHLAPLAPFAANGVPAAATLAAGIARVDSGPGQSIGAQAPGGGFLDRLQANAEQARSYSTGGCARGRRCLGRAGADRG